MDWFLYDNGLRHKRVNVDFVEMWIECNILILLKQGDSDGHFHHNKNYRNSEKNSPVGERIYVYTNMENLEIPQGHH